MSDETSKMSQLFGRSGQFRSVTIAGGEVVDTASTAADEGGVIDMSAAARRREPEPPKQPSQDSDSTDPRVIQQRLASMEEKIARLLRAFQIDDGTTPTPAQRQPTIKELRAMHARPGRSRGTDGLTDPTAALPRELLSALQQSASPKIQRKARHMPPRRVYSLKSLKRADLSTLTPAALTIAEYLAAHPRSTVNQLVDDTQFKRKTVENLLSILKAKEVVSVEDVKS